MIDRELIKSYKEAKYIIDINNKPCRIFVGQTHAIIDDLLDKHEKSCAYFITPENPFSQHLSLDENILRHHRFLKILDEKNYDYYLGYGTDEEEIWAKEKSYLIICDDQDAMHQLSSRFGQNGVLKLAKLCEVKLQVLAPMFYVDV